MNNKSFIRGFDEISLADLALVGGKNASLGEMVSNLVHAKVRVPQGFAITTAAYKNFLITNNLELAIAAALKNLDSTDLIKLSQASSVIKDLIKNAQFDASFIEEVRSYYEKLKAGRSDFRVAVRSSASLEDLPGASFAGQQDTYLHVVGFDAVLKHIKDVYASLFGERAIAYRVHNGFSSAEVLISVGVQEMVNSDLGCSGVMFSLDPETGFKDAIFINASFGLGEAVVSGSVNPDEFMIYKPSVRDDRLVILSQKLGSKAKKLVFAQASQNLEEVVVQKSQAEQFSLNAAELLELAHCALIIEEHYGRPMDIEWAKDEQGEIFILQARPETVHSNKNKPTLLSYHLDQPGELLCEGRAVGKRIGQGRARLLKHLSDAADFRIGDILVTDMTDPNWEPVMQKAQAIVTNRGGRTCHAAIIARELGIAAVVGCHDATAKINDLEDITVSCANGDTGQIFRGLLPIRKKEISVVEHTSPLPLMLIAANPSRALGYHHLPHQGIGLARLEFIIAHSIGVHPNAILGVNQIPKAIKDEIVRKANQFSSAPEFYTETLAQGISALAAVAHPHPIIVRLSDFKSNEYEELLGGHIFEQKENNPMIGFRGAARYISDSFKDAFALECAALKKAREDLGFSNIQIMVPFVRTLHEAEQVTKALAVHGLKRGCKGLKLIMMCEVPSNVILADQFLEFFDGFSIGSNDLTQLTLGIDRDSQLVAGQFSEKDPAVLKMIEMAITACKAQGKYIGICGQGPSDDLSFARWLIKQGIHSISLSPDTLADVHQALL